MSGFLVAQQTRIQVLTPKIERLPGCLLNVDAMDSGSMFQDAARLTRAGINDPVGGVLQPSGNHASQTVTAAKPMRGIGWNDLPVLIFDGGDYLICDSLAASAGVSGSDKPFTVVTAFKLPSVIPTHYLWSLNSSSIANTLDGIIFQGTTYLLSRRDDAGGIANPSVIAANTNPHVAMFLFSGTTLTFIVDGVTLINEVARNVGVLTIDLVTIGARRSLGSPTIYLQGSIGQLAVLNRRITTPEAMWATHLFGAKWGIVTL